MPAIDPGKPPWMMISVQYVWTATGSVDIRSKSDVRCGPNQLVRAVGRSPPTRRIVVDAGAKEFKQVSALKQMAGDPGTPRGLHVRSRCHR